MNEIKPILEDEAAFWSVTDTEKSTDATDIGLTSSSTSNDQNSAARDDLRCDVCKTGPYGDRRSLLRHERSPAHLRAVGKPVLDIRCYECGELFARTDILQRHVRVKHQGGTRLVGHSGNAEPSAGQSTLPTDRWTLSTDGGDDIQRASPPHPSFLVDNLNGNSSTSNTGLAILSVPHAPVIPVGEYNAIDNNLTVFDSLARHSSASHSNVYASTNIVIADELPVASPMYEQQLSDMEMSDAPETQPTALGARGRLDTIASKLQVAYRSGLMPQRGGRNPRSMQLPFTRPCPLCSKELAMDVNDLGEVQRHLEVHKLDYDGRILTINCVQCRIEFQTDKDLEYHLHCVDKLRSCGFGFAHVGLCTGHHPPLDGRHRHKNHVALKARLREWEHAQILDFQAYVKEFSEGRVRTNAPPYGESQPRFRQSDGSLYPTPSILSGQSTESAPQYNGYNTIKRRITLEGQSAVKRLTRTATIRKADNQDPLGKAIASKDLALARLLLNQRRKTGDSHNLREYIVAAVRSQNPAMLQLLIELATRPKIGSELDEEEITSIELDELIPHASFAKSDATYNLGRCLALLVARGIDIKNISLLISRIMQYTEARSILDALLETKSGIEINCTAMQSLLAAAIEHGYFYGVAHMLQAGADPNLIEESGEPGDPYETPLALAVKGKECKIAELLIQRGARTEFAKGVLELALERKSLDFLSVLIMSDPQFEERAVSIALSEPKGLLEWLLKCRPLCHAVDIAGNSPLMIAIGRNARDTVALLLEHGADVNSTNAAGVAPLALAIQSDQAGDDSLVALLLEHGANPNGSSPLATSIQQRNIKIVKLLLHRNAHVGVREAESCIRLAVDEDDLELVNMLPQDAIAFDQTNNLDYAIECGRKAVMKSLITRGVKISQKLVERCINWAILDDDATMVYVLPSSAVTFDQSNAVAAALAGGRNSVVKALVKRNPPLTAPTIERIITWAVETGDDMSLEILLRRRTGFNRCAALQLSVLRDNRSAVMLLLKYRADPEIPEQRGLHRCWHDELKEELSVELLLGGAVTNKEVTTLSTAVQKGNTAAVELLITCGADIDYVIAGESSPLFEAIQSRGSKIFEIFVEHDVVKKGRNTLTIAVLRRDIHAVRLLLESGVDANVRNSEGLSALMLATVNGESAIVKELLEYHADINAPDLEGRTCLEHATQLGDIILMKLFLRRKASLGRALEIAVIQGTTDIVMLLLSYGARLDTMDENGLSAFSSAISKNNAAVIQLLFEGGIIVPQPKVDDVARLLLRTFAVDNNVLLETAIRKRNDKIAKLLLQHGSDPNALTGSGWSLLALAVNQGTLMATSLLLEHKGKLSLSHGSEPNASGLENCSLLEFAIRSQRIDVVELLLGRSAVLDAANAEHEYPLHVAITHGKPGIVDALLKHGANANSKSGPGYWPLELAVQHGSLTVVRNLLGHGADANIRSEEKCTMLDLAILSDRSDIAHALLEHGIKVNAKSGVSPGTSHLAAAICKHRHDIAGRLIKHGADLTISGAHTPLHLAVQHQNLAICRALLRNGAGVNDLDGDGHSPLHTAVCADRRKIAELLLNFGAAVNVLCSHGCPLIGIAARHGHVAIARLLLVYGAHTHVRDSYGNTPFYLARQGNSTNMDSMTKLLNRFPY